MLVDFIADWTSPEKTITDISELWTIYYDMAYCNDGAAVAAIIISPMGVKTRFTARLEFCKFKATNNIAEYEALLLALRKMKALGQPNLLLEPTPWW